MLPRGSVGFSEALKSHFPAAKPIDQIGGALSKRSGLAIRLVSSSKSILKAARVDVQSQTALRVPTITQLFALRLTK